MARPLRIEFPGAIYHITSRGNARQNIFFHASDRRLFLDFLGSVCRRYDWECFAFCLMPNHYHLVLQTHAATLSRGMRQLNGTYTQRFNYRHKRVGHLLQGRFHSVLVDAEPYLLEVVRYTLQNPVRAQLATSVEQCRWTSYRATIGIESAPDWLQSGGLLKHFGADITRARTAFINFVRDGECKSAIWNNLRQQIYLGDEDFVRCVQQRVPAAGLRDTEVPRVQRRLDKSSLQEILARHDSRDSGITAAFQTGRFTMNEIAREIGVHYVTVSRAIRKEAAKMSECKT